MKRIKPPLFFRRRLVGSGVGEVRSYEVGRLEYLRDFRLCGRRVAVCPCVSLTLLVIDCYPLASFQNEIERLKVLPVARSSSLMALLRSI